MFAEQRMQPPALGAAHSGGARRHALPGAAIALALVSIVCPGFLDLTAAGWRPQGRPYCQDWTAATAGSTGPSWRTLRRWDAIAPRCRNCRALPAPAGRAQPGAPPPPRLQALPPHCYTGEDTAAWLRDELLTLRLEGTAAADVAVAGERRCRRKNAS